MFSLKRLLRKLSGIDDLERVLEQKLERMQQELQILQPPVSSSQTLPKLQPEHVSVELPTYPPVYDPHIGIN